MEIFRPLEYYNLHLREAFREAAEAEIDSLTAASGIDREANRELCARIRKAERKRDAANSKASWITILVVLGWIAVAAALVMAIFQDVSDLDFNQRILAGGIAVGLIIILVWALHPWLKRVKEKRDEYADQVQSLTAEAYEQMSAFNRLFDWDMFARLVSKVMPGIEFDPFVTQQRLDDLNYYGMQTTLGADTAVLYAHSGAIFGSPFVLCKVRTQKWGTRTYHGSKVISWTERDSQGRVVHRSQTLHASVTKPYPEFPDTTVVIFGNPAAPDLTFNRRMNTSDNAISNALKKWKLRRKSRDMDSDYAMSTNEDFEVLFATPDRNNNQQFFLLFTPLAQESMVELLRDRKSGYGDDFDFFKQQRINTIFPRHMQSQRLDMDPAQFISYEYDESRQLFISRMCEYFRSLYFALAPLLCVPIYQQAKPLSGERRMMRPSEWECESLAYYWGEDHFRAPECVTDCILKTHQQGDRVQVSAAGFGGEKRVDYVRVLGGDGYTHSVPVEWVHYYPVEGRGSFEIHEQPDHVAPADPNDRADAIRDLVDRFARGGIFRRGIVTRL